MLTRAFLTDTAERAAKTAAQALLAFWSADGIFDVVSADWGEALTVAASATVLSLLSSVVSYKAGHTGTASLTTAVEPAAHSLRARDPQPGRGRDGGVDDQRFRI